MFSTSCELDNGLHRFACIFNNKEHTFRVVFYVIMLWIVLKIGNTILVEQYHRPNQVSLGCSRTLLGRWLTILKCSFDTPSIVSEGFRKAQGKAFAVPTLNNYHVYLSNSDHIKELNNAPAKQLSFNGVLADVVFPKYTMHGYSYNPEDPQNSWSVATLKSGLRSNLPVMRKDLQRLLELNFDREIQGKPSADGWIKISPSSVVHRVLCSLNTHMILGEELAKNPRNVKAAADYARDAVITTETLQRIPSIFHPGEYLDELEWRGKAVEKIDRDSGTQPAFETYEGEAYFVQWMIDSPRKDQDGSTLAIAQRTLGFIFGSAYQMPMFITFAIYRLCKHPEYLPLLLQEVTLMSPDEVHSNKKQDTPFLDSFLKETARLHPLQVGSADRKVMTPFTFSDGTHIPTGNYIRIAQQALMLDPDVYSNPTEFQPSRFISDESNERASHSRLSQPSPTFPFWGSVGRACPGRFYVSMIAKMTVVYILTHYDLKLVDDKANPHFAWGSNIIPNPFMKIFIRPKRVAASFEKST
ncbi:cytochrome P450 [Tricladium varicosporioides]|nr:cytochrome P450 [Hymenoscyphus varicosporioides]